MGVWFLEGWGNKDTQIMEEIAKEHKIPIKVVEKHYKEMLEKAKNEVKD